MNTEKTIHRELREKKNKTRIEKLKHKLENKEFKSCVVRIKTDSHGNIIECRKEELIRDIIQYKVLKLK